MVRLITDGACEGNPGPGGWAAIILWDRQEVQELGGAEAHTTNNRMELRAAIEGLRRIPHDEQVEVTTDSQYLLKGITQWIQRWKKNGWLTTQKREVENRDLWQALDQAAGERVTWVWVKGHAGNVYNERADKIASAFAQGRKPVPGLRMERQATPEQEQPVPETGFLEPAQGILKLDLSPGPARVSYLSLVRGELRRHSTWAECQARITGVSGAKFKKCRSVQEEMETIKGWGLPKDALSGL